MSLSAGTPHVVERRDVGRREAIVRRIVAEFQDMPGLVLSLKQASRFLGVDEAACARILTNLTKAGVLRRSASEYYSKREPGI
jgi:DNA-binding Lrp family transcriptional regulator